MSQKELTQHQTWSAPFHLAMTYSILLDEYARDDNSDVPNLFNLLRRTQVSTAQRWPGTCRRERADNSMQNKEQIDLCLYNIQFALKEYIGQRRMYQEHPS
jgi:hypothetical protein